MFDREFIKEIRCLIEKVEEIYIYGAGLRAEDVYNVLKKNGITVSGFLVTEEPESIVKMDLPIIKAENVLKNCNCGIVMGVGMFSAKEIFTYLAENNVDMDRVVDGGKYVTKYRGRDVVYKEEFLEVTTVIGCKVNCRLCPQDKLIKKYFENNNRRESILKLNDFEQILNHVSTDCNIMFSGMAEPFLNPDCIALLRLACDSGRKVRLYSTLVGATKEDINELIQLPLDYVSLHIADEKNYANIETSEDYYEMIELLLNVNKCNKNEPFVNEINSQTTPDKRIEKMCLGKYEIATSIHDRAGNLYGNEVLKRSKKINREQAVCTSFGPKINNHVVLPDGTLLLCPMDYGMKHVLGNLIEKTYDELQNGETMNKIFSALQGKSTDDILCKSCTSAHVIEK